MARHASAGGRYYGRDFDDDYFDAELVPGDRIGPPLRSRGRVLLQGLLFLLIVGGIGVTLVNTAQTWMPMVQSATRMVAAALPQRVSPAEAPPTTLPRAAAPPLTAPLVPVAPPTVTASLQRPSASSADTLAAAPTSAALATGAPPAAATESEPAPGEPLPAPTVDPSDPYPVRAAAVGLHPGLSRVLLARLSPTDYHNAGIAIETALAKTPEGGVYVFPRQQKGELAVFQVHFVAGAAPGCRRYVVVVAKDRWLTTAPPMEKCGLQKVGRRD